MLHIRLQISRQAAAVAVQRSPQRIKALLNNGGGGGARKRVPAGLHPGFCPLLVKSGSQEVQLLAARPRPGLRLLLGALDLACQHRHGLRDGQHLCRGSRRLGGRAHLASALACPVLCPARAYGVKGEQGQAQVQGGREIGVISAPAWSVQSPAPTHGVGAGAQGVGVIDWISAHFLANTSTGFCLQPEVASALGLVLWPAPAQE